MTGGELKVFGALLDGYVKACLNLNIVAGRRAVSLTDDIEVMSWYPFQQLKAIEKTVVSSYQSAAPIMERVGMEMMLGWYFHGPGQGIVSTGVGFLHYQSSSEGYASVVQGPAEKVGEFKLLELDASRGHAVVHSTTPFNRDLERGVLIGGMSAPGDLDFIDVQRGESSDFFIVEFH